MAQTLASVAVGSTVKLNENGAAVDYLVVHQGLPSSMYDESCNGTWLLRKDIYSEQAWSATSSGTYANSTINTYLNNTFKALFSPPIQAAIKRVKIPYYAAGAIPSGANGLSTKIFLLCGFEVGFNQNVEQYFPVDGAKLSYFDVGTGTTALNKRKANFNGAVYSWWLRTPRTQNVQNIYGVNQNGSYTFNGKTTTIGVRPAMIFPGETIVSDDGTIIIPPDAPETLTVPSLAMQGQDVAISWSEVDGADGYILERKADSGAWTQVYSGAALTYTDTAGTWSTVQFRVKAGISGTYGDYATSAAIPVVAASSLSISGADGDLGTLTADVEYSVVTDTGNPITLTVTVNGQAWSSGQVGTSYSGSLPVAELTTGAGSIVLAASVETSSGPVSVTRSWTYFKSARTFPNAGAASVLSQGGVNQFPLTLAEAVRTNPFWRGSLDKALSMLANSVQFIQTQTPKYTAVTVDLSNVQVGDEINLPYNGELRPHIVLHVGNPDPSLYDASCNGVWVLQKKIYGSVKWNNTAQNVYPASTINTTELPERLSNYGASVQSKIKTVKIPYCPGNGSISINSGANGLETKLFLLSCYETGLSQSDSNIYPVSGAKLDYFISGTSGEAREKRYAETETAEIEQWWSRDPVYNDASGALLIAANGNGGIGAVSDNNFIRPAFILPSDDSITYYVDDEGNLHDEQEYEAGGSITDVHGNPITIGAQIATGSYTGTGVEGQSNPTSIVLPKKPDIVIIGTCDQYNHLYFSLFPVGYFPNNIDVEGGYTLFDRGATLGGGNTTIIRSCYAKFNDSTKELTWSYRYSSIGSNGSNQLNGRNTTYVWHAICFP